MSREQGEPNFVYKQILHMLRLLLNAGRLSACFPGFFLSFADRFHSKFDMGIILKDVPQWQGQVARGELDFIQEPDDVVHTLTGM